MKNDKLISWEDAVIWLRQQPDKADLVRACYYDDPLQQAAERYYQSSEWKEIQKLLTEKVTGSVLDIGAGRGISSYALAKDGWQVTALEPDNSNIVGSGAIKQLAAEANLQIELSEECGESLPFDNNSFDLVFARQVLHHARNLSQFCNEIYRVMKPGGLFIATREHVISRQKDLQRFLKAHPLHHLYGGENAYTLSTYKFALLKSGLRISHVLGPYESDINLFPDNTHELRKRLLKRIKFPISDFLFKFVVYAHTILNNTPGRLYSFIGHKE